MENDTTVVENPVTGERATFRKRSAQTGGVLLEFELALEPRPAAAPEHIHSRQEEHIEVTSGAVHLRLGGKQQRLDTGAAMTLPAGVAHTLWNDGEEEARVLVQVRPALRTEVAIETIFGLARDGKTNKQGNPNPLQGALLAREYETFFGWPPVPVQKALLVPLAPVRGCSATALGIRSTAAQRTTSGAPVLPGQRVPAPISVKHALRDVVLAGKEPTTDHILCPRRARANVRWMVVRFLPWNRASSTPRPGTG